jgi:hypothetical protein
MRLKIVWCDHDNPRITGRDEGAEMLLAIIICLILIVDHSIELHRLKLKVMELEYQAKAAKILEKKV